MALRQIVQIGEPVLRKKSKKVEVIDEKIIQLLEYMIYQLSHYLN